MLFGNDAMIHVNYNKQADGIEVRFNFKLSKEQKAYVMKLFANRWLSSKQCFWAKVNTPTYYAVVEYLDALENGRTKSGKKYSIKVFEDLTWSKNNVYTW